MTTPVKVLYVMGAGRSGSTVLDNILGELDGFASVGELHNLWKRGLVRGGECGCGRPLSVCEVWQSVLSTAAESLDISRIDAPSVRSSQEEALQMRHTRKIARANRPSGWPELDAYVEVLTEIYRAIGRVMDARVVVDSSKRPPTAAALHLTAGIEPYYLHLVRDPRAVAYSRTRHKVAHGREMRKASAGRTTGRWLLHNSLAEIVHHHVPAKRYLFLRYEDFVRRPRLSIESIVRFIGEVPAQWPFVDDRTVTLTANHTAAGNPSRFKTGPVEIREDNEWRVRMRRTDMFVATALAAPLMRRYGYSPRRRNEPIEGRRSPALDRGVSDNDDARSWVA